MNSERPSLVATCWRSPFALSKPSSRRFSWPSLRCASPFPLEKFHRIIPRMQARHFTNFQSQRLISESPSPWRSGIVRSPGFVCGVSRSLHRMGRQQNPLRGTGGLVGSCFIGVQKRLQSNNAGSHLSCWILRTILLAILPGQSTALPAAARQCYCDIYLASTCSSTQSTQPEQNKQRETRAANTRSWGMVPAK